MIAAAVLGLVADGLLALDDPAPRRRARTRSATSSITRAARASTARSRPTTRRCGTGRWSRWTDAAFLEATNAGGPEFAPGSSWGYSNTGYLLLRRVIDAHGGLASFLPRLGLAGTTVAEAPADLLPAVPAPSTLIGDGVPDVRGRYDPRWVGHRALVATAGDLLGFWQSLPRGMLDPATFVPIGREAPGFVRPSYGLGVMADPGSPLGTVVGSRRRRSRVTPTRCSRSRPWTLSRSS